MKNFYILLILYFIPYGLVFAQPGEYSGVLKFKVYKDGKIINLSDKNWKITTGKYTQLENQKPYDFPNFYQITPKGTPMGGMVSEDFYLDIIFKKDTMKILTPSFRSEDVILDSIPFMKGTFKIPQHIYDLKYLTDNKFKKYQPKINGNWELFKKKSFNCYIEKIESLDNVSQNNFSSYTNEFDYILIPDRQYYYFKENVIIDTNDNENFTIYEVKDITEVTFWNRRLKSNKIKIKSLFYKEKTLYAIIDKFYDNTTGESYGIYKLHFVKDGIPKVFRNYLEMQQTTEDYNAIEKFIEKYPNHWPGANSSDIDHLIPV